MLHFALLILHRSGCWRFFDLSRWNLKKQLDELPTSLMPLQVSFLQCFICLMVLVLPYFIKYFFNFYSIYYPFFFFNVLIMYFCYQCYADSLMSKIVQRSPDVGRELEYLLATGNGNLRSCSGLGLQQVSRMPLYIFILLMDTCSKKDICDACLYMCT